MERLTLMLRFVLKRAWHQRAILLPVLLGVLAVATVLSSVPLFSTTAANASLRGTLNAANAALDHNVQVRFTTPTLDAYTYAQATEAVTANVQDYLGRDIAQTAPIQTGRLAHALPVHFSISGALSLDFVVAALLSVIGFVLLFYLLARRRAFEFGVLRAMGLSLRQLAGSLSWEQGILVCAAALLGGALGILLAQAVLPALATDNSGKPLLPPYAPQLDVGSVIQLGLFLVACALAALVATLVIFRRLRLQEVLRLGEE